MVSGETFWAVVGAGSMAITTLATAVYANRRYLNTMKQRLFGTDLDDTDDGVLMEIREDLQDIKEQMERDNGGPIGNHRGDD